MTDDELAQHLLKARNGNADAWTTLCEYFAPRLSSFVRGKGADDPDGMASVVLVTVMCRLTDIEQPGIEAFRAYMFRAARNAVLNERRSNARRPTFVPLPDSDSWQAAAASTSFEDEVSSRAWVAHAMGHLTRKQREVIQLRYIQDLSVRETAEILAIDPIAVKSLQRRGLAALRLMREPSATMSAPQWEASEESEESSDDWSIAESAEDRLAAWQDAV